MSGTAAQVRTALKELVDPDKAAFYPRFFKTGKGEYGERDRNAELQQARMTGRLGDRTI